MEEARDELLQLGAGGCLAVVEERMWDDPSWYNCIACGNESIEFKSARSPMRRPERIHRAVLRFQLNPSQSRLQMCGAFPARQRLLGVVSLVDVDKAPWQNFSCTGLPLWSDIWISKSRRYGLWMTMGG